MTAELNFLYLHKDSIGYGYHGIKTHEALTELGVDVYDGLPGSGDLDLDKKNAKICRDVLYLSIPTHVTGWWVGQRPHLFTMWEGSELPEEMRSTLHNFETIIVPSEECRQLYSRYHDNVHMVPLGVDSRRWAFSERRAEDTFFTFLIAGSGPRKGNDLVHRAFMELFGNKPLDPSKPIPRLVMKNPRGEDYYGPNVEVISGHLTAEEEVELYASANCYVQPARGEGWGMQPLQALAQGLPTILTNAHGHVPFAQYGIPLDATRVETDFLSMFGKAGQWWEPDYEQLKRAMLHVYENYDDHVKRAARNSTLVAERFTWKKSAQAILDVIGIEHLEESAGFRETPNQWYTPDVKQFRVVTTRDWRADIGGVVHVLYKGQEYWKSADVKRILFENEVLDPICLDNGDGLTVQQIERLSSYISSKNECPTCGHALNDDIEDDEDDEESVSV